MDKIPGLTLIGLTGPSGAGKSYIADLFAQNGIPSVNTDEVYHSLLIPPSPCLDALADAFSPAILRPDGSLDRGALSALVFEKTEQGATRLATLNRISHRFILERCHEILCRLAADGARFAILDAPLLIEAGLCDVCDRVIVVLADRELRLRRLMARDTLSKEQLLARLDAQPGDEFYRDHADDVICNNSSPEEVERQVSRICRELRREEAAK